MKKRRISRLFSVLLALVVIVGTFNLPMNVKEARADTIVDSGDCGASGGNVTWTLDCDGVLKISGTGAMKTYGDSSSMPWNTRKAEINTIIIENGVTEIGQFCFCECSNVTTVSIPDSVTIIKMNAFLNCTSLTDIHLPEELTEIGGGAFLNCTSLTSIIIPEKLTSLETYSFIDCASLKNIQFLGLTPPVFHRDCIPAGVNIIVPDGCKSSYESELLNLSWFSPGAIIEASQVVPPTGGGNNGGNSNNSSSSSSSETPVHQHTYEWVVTQEPTFTNRGINSLVCTSCGHVSEIVYIGNDAVVYNTFANMLEEQISNVNPGDDLVLELGDWHSIPAYLMERIIDCGYDVEVKYRYKGVDYDIVIPVGGGINLDIPWYGPLLMYSIYGNI